MVEDVVSVAPGWLVAGVLLHVLQQVVRTRGWFTIIRAAYPEATELRARDVTFAYLAGSGLNSVVPARGGDLAKLYLVRRRAPGARWSTLAATFVPETLFETAVGIGLVIWAEPRLPARADRGGRGAVARGLALHCASVHLDGRRRGGRGGGCAAVPGVAAADARTGRRPAAGVRHHGAAARFRARGGCVAGACADDPPGLDRVLDGGVRAPGDRR